LKRRTSTANGTAPATQQRDERLSEELGRLNNELIALQLQLAGKNDQLQKARELLARQGLRCLTHDLPAGECFKIDPPTDNSAADIERALALVRQIVQQHGGRFWKETAGPDNDVRFCFTLGSDPHRINP